MYYDKYLKYKYKYLQLKKQLGGKEFCEKAYKNVWDTCWAVAIQTMFTFGQATSNDLKRVIESIKGNDFVRQRILKLKSMPQLMNFYPDDILNERNRTFLENIINKFIDRYNSKVSTKEPEKRNDLTNPERCELVIAQNFKNLFKHPILTRDGNLYYKYGGNLLHEYLFANLLSVFFF